MALPPRRTLVKNQLMHPDGTPRAGERVEFYVRAVTDWRADREGRIVGTTSTWTGPKGLWRICLLPWTAYDARLNTIVEVREGGVTTGYIQVPEVELGVECWMGNLLVDPPPPARWSPIARLGDLHDVDRESVAAAPDGAVLIKRGGRWVAERLTLRTLPDIDPSVRWAQYDDPLVYLGDGMWGVHQFAPIDVRFGLVEPADPFTLWFEGVQYSPDYEFEYQITPGMDTWTRWGDPAQRLQYAFPAAGNYLVQVRYLGINPQQQEATAWGRTITIPFEEAG